MKLKSAEILFIFIFFSCIFFSFQEIIELKYPITEDLEPTNTTYKIIIDKKATNFKKYFEFDIIMESPIDLTPLISISKDDENCVNNRLYLTSQTPSYSYFFLVKDELPEQGYFYMCVLARKNLSKFHLNVFNEDSAKIPTDTQVSYLVNKYNTNMNFIIQSSNSTNFNIWVKGEKIKEVRDKSNHFTSVPFDFGYVLYGQVSESHYEIEVTGQIGDYITVGSMSIKDGKVQKRLEENEKEVTGVITNNEELCFSIAMEFDYPMNILGKIYTNKAQTYYKNESGIIEITRTNITNGILSDLNMLSYYEKEYGRDGQFCLKKIESSDDLIIFSIQQTTNREKQLVHGPMMPGEINRHYLFEGEIAIFYGMKPGSNAKEVNLNLKSFKGFPEMYYDECTNFPNCEYNEESLKDKINPFPSNRMTVYSFYIEEENEEYKSYNPMTSFQPVMIVYCKKGGKPESLDSAFCEFDTFYFTNDDTVKIYEGNTFSQYLLDGETDYYKINLENENGVEKIYLDLLLFSGDVDLILVGDINKNSHKYYLSNKLFYSIDVNSNIKKVEFEIKAQKKSFYMIQYQLVKKDGVSKDFNHLESGVNYIVSAQVSNDDNEGKIIELDNFKFEFEIPYLVTFYSQNSEFIATRILSTGTEEDIALFENFGQLVIDSVDYEHEKYRFEVNITSDNQFKSPNMLYMIYAAGLELDNIRSISLSEGVPHRFIFTEKYSSINYAYHISDYTKTVVLNFKLIDKSIFNVTIHVGRTFVRSQDVYRDGQIFLMNTDLLGKCQDFEVCTVIVAIENTVKNNENKTMEFSMYQVEGTPFYLERNTMKKDILHGNLPKHYYLDVYDYESGDITLNFKRGSGFIYATIQKINLDVPMESPDWRGLYKFPTDNDESLKFSAYNKKIFFNEESTRDCIEGCYILITVINSLYNDDGYDDDSTPYRISITPKIYSLKDTRESAIPKINIEINEFVTGDIDLLTISERKYDYYELKLPYDSDYVYIDWQGDYPSFLINIGKRRPTLEDKESYHYISGNVGQDYVYRFDKEDILAKLNSTQNTIQNLDLTIGVYSNNIDSIYSSPYAFKFFMAKKDFNIIHIRNDQKVQCSPIEKQGEYICYFAVIFDELDINSNLIIYPRSQSGEKIDVYGNFFDSEKVEQNDIQTIITYFKQIKGNLNYKMNKKYIYHRDIQEKTSYLLMTISKSRDDIEVLSSTYYFYNEMNFYPNPSTAQIFAIGKNIIKLNFQTTQDLLLNIVSISQEGHFNWNTTVQSESQKYYLSGFEDRLSLTTFTKDEETKLSALMIDASDSSISDNDMSGFIFYITYYPRNSGFSLDQVRQGRSLEFNYRTVNFPIFFFAPITDVNSYSVNFDFYDFKIEDSNVISYDNNLFNIWGTVVEEEEINNIRFNPPIRPKYDASTSMKGCFDSAFGNLIINKEFINKFKNMKKPTLYFGIENSDANKKIVNLGLELSLYSDFISLGQEKSIPENVYLNGDFKKQENKKYSYSLITDKDNPYLRIEFSAISDLIKYAISTEVFGEQNDTSIGEFDGEVANGRSLLTIKLNNEFFNSNKKLYFTIYAKENIDEKLGHYIFKYLNTQKNSDFFPFSFNDNNVTYEKQETNGKKNYKVTFKPIEQNDVTYYIKAIYGKTKIKNEKMDSIAVSESPGQFLQVNKINNKDPELSFILEDLKEEISDIKVLAKVAMKAQKIFLLYNPTSVPYKEEPPKVEEKDNIDNTTLYIGIGIGVFLLVVVIVLIAVIVFNMRKNKDLLDRVNKISFMDSRGEKNDDNLLINNDNELD